MAGETALGIKQELGVSTKTAQRMVCLLQLAYFTRRFRSLLAGPVDIDEIYIAGIKGRTGGLALEQPPRKQRWKGPPLLSLAQRPRRRLRAGCSIEPTQSLEFSRRGYSQNEQPTTHWEISQDRGRLSISHDLSFLSFPQKGGGSKWLYSIITRARR